MSVSGVRCSSPVSSIAVEESAAVPDATIGVFSNSRSSHSTSANAGIWLPNAKPSTYTPKGNGKRLNKRQKTMGMNAKFDRMVNSLHVHENNINHGDTPHRRKGSRSGSMASTASSVHSRNIPDAYSDSGRSAKIGATFGLVRKKTPSAQASNPHPFSIPGTSGILNTPTQEPEKGLPPWLSNTFSTLDPDNPLRFLIPKEHVRTSSQSSCPDNQAHPDQHLHEGQIFAFEHSPAPSISSRSALHSLNEPNRVGDPSRREETVMHTLYAPFSTPGPCYNSSLAETAGVSPALAALNSPHPQTPEGSSSPIQLEFIPFSVPGPASTISTHSPSKPLVSLFHPVELSPPPEVDIMGPAVTRISSTPLRHSKISFAAQNTPSSDYLQTENTDIADPAFNSYSDELPDLDHCEDPLTDDSGSDPFYDAANTSHTAIETFDIFKSPGPTYYAAQPVYFDSPTEEEVDSDPGYKIDYGDLDFSWTPYFRDKDVNSPDSNLMSLPKQLLEGESGETHGALHAEIQDIEHLEGKGDESTKEIEPPPAPTRISAVPTFRHPCLVAKKSVLADANVTLKTIR